MFEPGSLIHLRRRSTKQIVEAKIVRTFIDCQTDELVLEAELPDGQRIEVPLAAIVPAEVTA